MSGRLPDGVALVPLSIGELIDKLTILEIKSERIDDEEKLGNVRREAAMLERALAELNVGSAFAALRAELKAINEALWEIEDLIRDCERDGEFGERFIALARSVYRTNDRRAAVKRQINEGAGAGIVEEKSYRPY